MIVSNFYHYSFLTKTIIFGKPSIHQTIPHNKGYLTEEHSIGSKSSMDSNNHGNMSVLAPLPKVQSKRRSKSAVGLKESASLQTSHTPGPRALMSASKLKTPLFLQQHPSSTHMSR